MVGIGFDAKRSGFRVCIYCTTLSISLSLTLTTHPNSEHLFYKVQQTLVETPKSNLEHRDTGVEVSQTWV